MTNTDTAGIAAIAIHAAAFLNAAAECGVTELTEAQIQNKLIDGLGLYIGPECVPALITTFDNVCDALCDAGYTPTIAVDGHLPAFYTAAA